MSNVHESETKTKSKARAMQSGGHERSEAIRERVEKARDLLENLRDQAETTFKEKPYLVPVTAGAVGFGVGLLFGSKLMRFVALTAIGTILTDAFGGEIKRISADFMDDLKSRMDDEDATH